jgi:hypothetical protein
MGDNLEDVFLLAEEARVGPGEFVEADGEVDLVDVEVAEVETDLHLRAVSGADCTAAEAAAEVSLKTGAGFDVAVAITEDVSELIDLRIEIDSVANPEATSDTRFKKVRKAEAMGTAAAEPLAVTEKKRRVDGVFLVESEAERNAGYAGLGSGEMQSCAIRADEAHLLEVPNVLKECRSVSEIYEVILDAIDDPAILHEARVIQNQLVPAGSAIKKTNVMAAGVYEVIT